MISVFDLCLTFVSMLVVVMFVLMLVVLMSVLMSCVVSSALMLLVVMCVLTLVVKHLSVGGREGWRGSEGYAYCLKQFVGNITFRNS